MRYVVTLMNASGRETVVPVDARTMQGACARAATRMNRAEPLDTAGKRNDWRPLAGGVMPMHWTGQ